MAPPPDTALADLWYQRAYETGSEEVKNKVRLHHAHVLRKTDPEHAYTELRTLAEKGFSAGMVQLGWCYEKGIGVAADAQLAEMWYRRAYETGSEIVKERAIYYLGWLYLRQKDFAKAREIFAAGAEINYAPAIYHLGRLYWRGLGGKKQPSEARIMFERASKLGHLLAQRNLAILLMSGRFGIFNIRNGLRLLFQSIKEIWVVAGQSSDDERQDERIKR